MNTYIEKSVWRGHAMKEKRREAKTTIRCQYFFLIKYNRYIARPYYYCNSIVLRSVAGNDIARARILALPSRSRGR